MNTKSKGDATEAHILAALVDKGLPVLIPFGDNQRYDLVVEIEKSFQRVQCKTGRYINGAIAFDTCSNRATTAGEKRGYKGDVDYFGVYCKKIGKAYLIPFDDVKDVSREARLRVEQSRNGQAKGIRLARDYEI